MNTKELLSMLETYGAVNVTGEHDSEAVRNVITFGSTKLIKIPFHGHRDMGWALVESKERVIK